MKALMMKQNQTDYFFRLLFFILCSAHIFLHPTTVTKKTCKKLPTITASWADLPKSEMISVKSAHLHAKPFFDLFDYDFFMKHRLSTHVFYRYEPNKQVSNQKFEQCIMRLLSELGHGKRKYTDFIVLKRVDFSVSRCCGSLILKFKNYPFVLKLFIEKPYSLLHPFEKGIFSQSFFHYVMGHGMSRHLNGFTRIENLHNIKHAIAASPQWRNRVAFPRKWFWLPPKESIWNRWITITSKNMGAQKQQIRIPAVYGVIADFIDMDPFSWFNKNQRKMALELCNCVQMNLDQNVSNFAFEKQTGKIVIVDTEHFPSLIGWSGKPYRFTSYPAFWLTLGWKIAKDLTAYMLQIKTNPAQ